jgi:hypothetical protein
VKLIAKTSYEATCARGLLLASALLIGLTLTLSLVLMLVGITTRAGEAFEGAADFVHGE